MKLSNKGKIAAFLCVLSTIKYTSVQGLALVGFIEFNYDMVLFGFISTLFFVPSVAYLLWEIWYLQREEKKT